MGVALRRSWVAVGAAESGARLRELVGFSLRFGLRFRFSRYEARMSPAGEVKNDDEGKLDAERRLDEAVNRAAVISSDAAAVHEAFGAFVRGFDLLRELKDPRAHLQIIATVLHAVRDRSLQLQEELDNRSRPGSNVDQV